MEAYLLLYDRDNVSVATTSSASNVLHLNLSHVVLEQLAWYRNIL